MTTEAFEVVTSDRVRPRVVAKKRPPGPRYVARKPMVIGDKKIRIGDLVPEASAWPRVEAWVRSGYIDIVEE